MLPQFSGSLKVCLPLLGLAWLGGCSEAGSDSSGGALASMGASEGKGLGLGGGDSTGPDGSGGATGDKSDPIACAEQDIIETLTDLPAELAARLEIQATVNEGGVEQLVNLDSEWLEDGERVLRAGVFGTAGRNVLYDAQSGQWSIVQGDVFRPRALVDGQFVGFRNNATQIDFSAGAHLDVATNAWVLLPSSEAPSPRQDHVEVVTGDGLFVWGGGNKAEGQTEVTALSTGGYLDAKSWTWTPVSEVGAPSPRTLAFSAWTGQVVLVYGGKSLGADATTGATSSTPLSDGFRYNPQTGSWSPMSDAGALMPNPKTAVGFGEKLLVLGLDDELGTLGAVYDTPSDTWSALSMSHGPDVAYDVAHLTPPGSTEQLVFSGWAEVGAEGVSLTIFIYDTAGNAWRSVQISEALGGRVTPSYLWYEGKLVVWGGLMMTVEYCDEETRAANPGVGCDPKYDYFPVETGFQLRLSCP
jgi:hypothetical protein